MSPEDEAQAHMDRVLQLKRFSQLDLFDELDSLAAPTAAAKANSSQKMSADEVAAWQGLSDAANDPEIAQWLEDAEAAGMVGFGLTPAEKVSAAPAPVLAARPAIEARQQKIRAKKEASARERAEKQARLDEIEAWRKANPEEHSKRRRAKRRNKRFTETGTLPRIYRRNKTAEEKRADANERKRRSRNGMTPEQKKVDRKRPKAPPT